MFVSDRTQLALRALCHLTFRRAEQTVAVRQLAEWVGVSEKNMESILTPLRQSGVVSASKGRAGGYRLSRDPTDLSLLVILEALDSRWRAAESAFPSEPEAPFLFDLERTFRSHLSKATLQDVVDRYHRDRGSLTYSI